MWGHVRGIPVKGWGVVRTKPGKDLEAKENLERQDVRCFMPRARHDYKARLFPLFPGYLFFQVPQYAWGFICNTRGVRDVIRSGEKPGLVHPSGMRALLGALNEENFLDLRTIGSFPPLSEPLVPGEVVTIKEGVFKNFAAVYKATLPNDRIRLITEFMGKATEVDLERRAIIRQRRELDGTSRASAVATKK